MSKLSFQKKNEGGKEKKKHSPRNMIEKLGTRSFRVGGYSVLAVVMVIVIAIAANVLVGALPSGITQFDTTANDLFDLSEQTEQIVSGLEEDVTVYWIVQSGQEDSNVETLLDRYESLSGKLTVTKKDPDVYPTFVQQYTDDEQIYNNSFVVVCGDRSKYVGYENIYEYDTTDYYTTGTYETSFAGENALTSAIDYVTNDSLPKLYTLTGHGESSLSSTFSSAVESENIETEELSLLTVDGVPDDADCVLILAPTSDISDDEEEKLLTYLQGGGKLFLITNPQEDETDFDNLYALMENYGVTADDGIVVEGNQNNYIYNMPYYLLATINAHTITEPLIDGGYYVLLPIAQGLTVSEDLRDTLTVTELLTTSDDAFSKIDGYSMTTYEKESGDIDGPFALAVAIEETISSGDEEDADAEETESADAEETESAEEDSEEEESVTTNIVWVSSSALVDDSTNEMVSGGNEDFFLNAIGWMCEREESISIRAKSIDSESLTISSSAASIISVVIIGILPIGYLAFGICTMVRRKKR